MGGKKLNKTILSICITILFVATILTPIGFGNNVENSFNKETIENINYNIYHPSEKIMYQKDINNEYRINQVVCDDNVELEELNENHISTINTLNGPPMDSPWPMYCHDLRHTGRSPYSTIDTWNEVWMFETWGPVQGGSVIAEDGTIYTGAYPLYAIYPNGTLKWMFELDGWIVSCPAIDDNGTIYVGDRHGYFYAINSDGTGKWSYRVGNDIFSSPAIGDDGSIYFGNVIYPTDGYIYALYPNGTLKWTYKTGHVVYSSPVIGEDGTVYCGSHDTYLYALYPNNGTLKWKYKTGDWIRTSPCIGDDGTIYVVSLDGYLHAVNADGSLKWKTDVGAGTSPTIGQDGTIYCGYDKLYAINPTNGSIKWTFPVSGAIRGGTPCNSIDGTIYLGTHIGSFDDGEIIALYPDGNLKFRKKIKTVESPPAIGADGTIYIGSFGGDTKGYLHAFGIGPLKADANGPYYGLINEPLQFTGSSSGGYYPYSYHWDFGDTHTSEEQNPIHTYTNAGNYTVTLTVIDNSSNSSSDISWTQVQATNEPPEKLIIEGVKIGGAHQDYDYTFVSTDPEDNPIWYYVDWDDNTDSGWLGHFDSGHQITLTHIWDEAKLYYIQVKTKDVFDAESEWSTFGVIISRNRVSYYSSLFLRFLEQFPLLERLLQIPLHVSF